MILEQLLAAVSGRGLTLALGPDGQPRVRGPRENLTPALIEALRAFRSELIEQLGPLPVLPPASPAVAAPPSPGDRPAELEWQEETGGVRTTALEGQAPRVPGNVTAWRVPGGAWRTLDELPPAWGLDWWWREPPPSEEAGAG